jgi:exodeoxyribonuclease V alpha subunit
MLRTIAKEAMGGTDPINDVQVLAAVNEKSPLARKALNAILQAELNPLGAKASGNPMRVGDKVVCLKNGRYKAVEFDGSDPDADVNDRNEAYVANGELARVLDVDTTSTTARLENPTRVVRIPRGGGESSQAESDGGEQAAESGAGCNWDLGYCLSVHKSQGSEWPVVITMLDDYPGARMVFSREFLYTAISRAKDTQYLIGRKATADAMCARPAIWRRKTFLRERIAIERARLEIAEL